MGIYTGNRTQLGPEAVGLNEAYANPLGALMLVTESYHNDAVMFENVIMSDFLEAVEIVKEADGEPEKLTGSVEPTEKTSDVAKKTILATIWEKIIKLIDMIKQKVNAIVERFVKAMDEFYAKKIKAAVEKNRKDYEAADLSNLTIKGFKKFKLGQVFTASGFRTALEAQADFGLYIGKDAKAIADAKEKNKDAENKIYGKLVGKDSVSASEFATLLYEDYFEKEVSEKPFTAEFKKLVLTILAAPTSERENVRKVRKELFAELDKKKAEAVRMKKEAAKLDKGDERSNHLAVANACYGLVSLVQKVSGTVLNHVMTCEKARVATAYKAFLRGAAYKAKSEAFTSEEYANAISEAAEFEMDMFFEMYNFEATPEV